MFNLSTDKGKRHKLDSEWSRGILVGLSGRTTELVVASPDGIHTCRTVRRVPSEHMTDPECLDKKMVSVSEFLKNGAKATNHEPKVVEPIPKAPHSEEVETRRKGIVPRRAILLKHDFEAHGYTEGCPECRHMNTGLGHRGRGHSDKCRRRMEVALGQEEEGKERLERGDERIYKRMEEKC